MPQKALALLPGQPLATVHCAVISKFFAPRFTRLKGRRQVSSCLSTYWFRVSAPLDNTRMTTAESFERPLLPLCSRTIAGALVYLGLNLLNQVRIATEHRSYLSHRDSITSNSHVRHHSVCRGLSLRARTDITFQTRCSMHMLPSRY